jgi:hypothetical protein
MFVEHCSSNFLDMRCYTYTMLTKNIVMKLTILRTDNLIS